MLVLQRKREESLTIAGNIVVKVCKIRGDAVRLGITAPAEVSIRRTELPDDGRPSRPPALPDVHAEVGRLRAENERLVGQLATLAAVVERLEAEWSKL